jgi:hypothetical protein
MVPQDAIRSSRPVLRMAALVLSLGLASVELGGGCGDSGHWLTTDTATPCSEVACAGPRPASPSVLCSDGSVAGPACIERAAGVCGWAILSCPLERGRSPNDNETGTGGLSGTGATHPSGAGGSGGFMSIPDSSGGIPGTGAGPGGPATGGTGGTADPGPFAGTGGNGTFSWTGNAETRSSTGSYEESASGTSFIITIASEVQASGAFCTVVGQFPALPPAVGFYPMADVDTPLVDGSFVARCSPGSAGKAVEDGSISGQVAISYSIPGRVEGSFNMHASRGISGTGGTLGGSVVYSGAFAVGCKDGRPITDPACGALPPAP